MVLGWLWGSSSSNDSVQNLDPSLQKVLNSQNSKLSSLPPAEKQTTYSEQLRQSADLPTRKEPGSQDQAPKVPPYSLYQDGRYAHLWKDYQPLDVVESRGETEMDKLKRLSEDNDERKAKLGQAALENCVFEQMAELDCLKNGNAISKLTMCRPEKKNFNKCYEMQSKFLKALGYWDAIGDDARADAIQMHSDTLWQRLQEQEQAIQKAKDDGQPLPQFESILSPASIQAAGGKLIRPPIRQPGVDPNYQYPDVPQELRERFDQRIKDMSKDEAKIEEAVFLAEMEQKRKVVVEASGYLRAEGDARRKRYETGEASLGDRIKRWTNWDSWDSKFPLPADAQSQQQPQPDASEPKK